MDIEEVDMAIRQVRIAGDPILEKVCKEVREITPRINELIDDMLDTMYEANGVGLAANQVGILKRIVVIDVSPEGDNPYILINPKILNKEGEQTGYEGCLSLPGKTGTVCRPNYVKITYQDRELNQQELEGTDLLARAICHELDHLEGHMYMELVEGDVIDVDKIPKEKEE